MTIVFEHIDSSLRSYHGISVEEHQCRIHLQGNVKDNLLDREEIEETIDGLKSFGYFGLMVPPFSVQMVPLLEINKYFPLE